MQPPKEYEASPVPFEVEYPDAAKFLMRVYAAGGYFKQPFNKLIMMPKLPPIVGLTPTEINNILNK